MPWQDRLDSSLELAAGLTAILGPALTILTLAWVLASKKNTTSAVAWCLVVIFLPVLGPLLFLLFGYQHVNRPLSRKRKHRRSFARVPHVFAWHQEEAYPGQGQFSFPADDPIYAPIWDEMARLAERYGGFPVTTGNELEFYNDGRSAFVSMLEAIRNAEHHVHLETFIFQPDATGREFLSALAAKARQGIEVRLLYDAMGSRSLARRHLRDLEQAGGKYSLFLPINPLRRRIQINMRNHRKLLVIDGRVAFTGGLNIGAEYLGLNPRFGPWRDTHMRLIGPAVSGLQRVFVEDWDFAAAESLQHTDYFPEIRAGKGCAVQIIESGPDKEHRAIRDTYFAAIVKARRRVWIATPYFVPDAGLLDALCLAAQMGVDVRLLGLHHPDKWIPFFAGRYHWDEVLRAGVKVYQYTEGMMHSKIVLVDGEWASVGTANFDNRSLYLNFEVGCLIYSTAAVSELEEAFLADLEKSVRLDRHVFVNRPFAARMLDNAARLLSPVL